MQINALKYTSAPTLEPYPALHRQPGWQTPDTNRVSHQATQPPRFLARAMSAPTVCYKNSIRLAAQGPRTRCQAAVGTRHCAFFASGRERYHMIPDEGLGLVLGSATGSGATYEQRSQSCASARTGERASNW